MPGAMAVLESRGVVVGWRQTVGPVSAQSTCKSPGGN